MKEEIFDFMRDEIIAPLDFIDLMFERTDEDGILYIPGWHYSRPGWISNAPGSTDENDSYRCKLEWNISKCEKIKAKFERVYLALEEISPLLTKLCEQPENAEKIIKNPSLTEIWDLYLKPFDIGDFNEEKFDEIYDKLNTVYWVKSIAERVAAGEKLEDFEKEVLTDYLDVTVTEEEMNYRQQYLKHLHKQAELRLGENICAYDIYVRVWRLCRLFELGAPKIIIYNEACQLAAAFVLHEYGISREIVDDNIRLRIERMELMSEEELDELYRPKKVNSRKSLAPLFVYEILCNKSDSKTHLRQQEILKELEKYPYEISLERKALSRIIHNLVDSMNYAVYQDKTGVWVDKERQTVN